MEDKRSENILEKLMQSIKSYRLPIFEWVPDYVLDFLYSDINAGATVFVLLIPQTMAYAVLADLPPVYGLYSATAALYIYCVFGYSRQLAIGPMAITSLLSGAAVADLGYDPKDDENAYISASLSLAMYTGLFLVLMGVFQLGSLTNFLSQSVLAGFITGSAGVIALSQLKYVLGLSIERKSYSHQIIYEICANLDKIHIYGEYLVLFDINCFCVLTTGDAGLVIGILTLTALYLNKRWRQAYKANMAARTSDKKAPPLSEWEMVQKKYLYPMSNATSLVAVVVTTLVSFLIHKNSSFTLPIVGNVPQGLKTPSWPSMDAEVIPGAFMIAVISFAGKDASTNHNMLWCTLFLYPEIV